jgi:hypothetical protein
LEPRARDRLATHRPTIGSRGKKTSQVAHRCRGALAIRAGHQSGLRGPLLARVSTQPGNLPAPSRDPDRHLGGGRRPMSCVRRLAPARIPHEHRSCPHMRTLRPFEPCKRFPGGPLCLENLLHIQSCRREHAAEAELQSLAFRGLTPQGPTYIYRGWWK